MTTHKSSDDYLEQAERIMLMADDVVDGAKMSKIDVAAQYVCGAQVAATMALTRAVQELTLATYGSRGMVAGASMKEQIEKFLDIPSQVDDLDDEPHRDELCARCGQPMEGDEDQVDIDEWQESLPHATSSWATIHRKCKRPGDVEVEEDN